MLLLSSISILSCSYSKLYLNLHFPTFANADCHANNSRAISVVYNCTIIALNIILYILEVLKCRGFKFLFLIYLNAILLDNCLTHIWYIVKMFGRGIGFLKNNTKYQANRYLFR